MSDNNNLNIHDIDPHRYDLENSNLYIGTTHSWDHYHMFDIKTDNTYDHNHVLNGRTAKTTIKNTGHIHSFELTIETQNGFHKVVGETGLPLDFEDGHRHFIKGLTNTDRNHIHFFEGYTSEDMK